MTRVIFGAILAALFAFTYLAIYYLKDSYKLLPIQDAKMFMPSDYSSWRQFTSPTGKFLASFPAVPQRATQTVKDPDDKQRQYDMYIAEQNNGTTYMISSIRFIDNKESDEMLQKTVITDLLSSDPTNQLKSMSVAQYQKFKTTNFTITNEKTTIDGMTFMDGEILYIITAIFPNQYYNKKDYEHFLDSFHLQ